MIWGSCGGEYWDYGLLKCDTIGWYIGTNIKKESINQKTIIFILQKSQVICIQTFHIPKYEIIITLPSKQYTMFIRIYSKNFLGSCLRITHKVVTGSVQVLWRGGCLYCWIIFHLSKYSNANSKSCGHLWINFFWGYSIYYLCLLCLGMFKYCITAGTVPSLHLYLLSHSNSMIPFHSKTTLLWRFIYCWQ